MNDFFKKEIIVESVSGAMYVEYGMGSLVHKNREFHGLVLVYPRHQDKNSKYVFSSGKSVSVGENEMIYIPKGSSYYVDANYSGECYAINFSLVSDENFEPFLFKPKSVPAYLTLFRRAAEVWKNKREAYQMKCMSIIYELMALMRSEHFAEYTTKSTASLILPAVEHIHRNYTGEVADIPMLAEMCGISEDYLRKIFKKVYGISPVKYLRQLRISYAEELIRSGLYTVTEAARLSGFKDACFFSREFRNATGFAPSEYGKFD